MLNRKSVKVVISVTLLIINIMLLTSVDAPLLAQAQSKLTGQLSTAKLVKVDRQPTSSGLSVLSNANITTERQGLAIINIGKLGQIKLDETTDMKVKFTPTDIGGRVTLGRIVISAHAGTKIRVETSAGTIVSDGAKETLLRIEANQAGVQVEALQHNAELVLSDKVQTISINNTPISPVSAKKKKAIPVLGGIIVAAWTTGAIYKFVKQNNSGQNNFGLSGSTLNSANPSAIIP